MTSQRHPLHREGLIQKMCFYSMTYFVARLAVVIEVAQQDSDFRMNSGILEFSFPSRKHFLWNGVNAVLLVGCLPAAKQLNLELE